jgi:hypothetical protein
MVTLLKGDSFKSDKGDKSDGETVYFTVYFGALSQARAGPRRTGAQRDSDGALLGHQHTLTGGDSL